MDTLQREKGDRIAICDFCHKVERPDGGWFPRRRASFPPAAFVSDICPTCCEQYVSLLLGNEAIDTDGEITFPAVHGRKSRSRVPRRHLLGIRRKR